MKQTTTTKLKTKKKIYIPVKNKFIISMIAGIAWMATSIYFSVPWIKDLSLYVTMPIAILIIAGIAYIPGYMNAFMVSSLLLDRQPKVKNTSPKVPVTILIACYNEEKSIENTVNYVATQDYEGEIRLIVIDNNSKDKTAETAKKAGEKMNLNLTVVHESKAGKNFALNTALAHVETEYVLTLDADTLLHKSALRHIVARLESSPDDVCAVAGTVLVRNSRGNILARIQEWDYFLGIASIKRLQGLFQSTLVAQGAFSLYKTELIRKVGGWPDAIGEDIVLTWSFLSNNCRVYFEPMAVAFTDVPTSLKHFFRQRSRWARGMVEALKLFKPWSQPIYSARYLTGCNLFMPFMDFVYTFCWLPGLVLAFFGHFWIVGPATLFVIPLALLQNFVLYTYQKGVFKSLNLRVRKNIIGFILYVLCYQLLMSPISVWGYIQETLKLRRIWK
ncbi:glycosyltransferase family 2 protein [Ruminiclostridium cellulolyticum]|uniref:Glycosyl transferase family 2 n=1 Tax=Ruminiclostridium cellulolyticum (strain ATCC 35319 / DSM 5812 / JCM 6584 / H10) TaxID=394503 RepID=B8I3J3_RUMCH|nr:glycosyltransferase [Ruminiclostridium cellulolyticum]ACL76336.1 glycosyl transferase family 2 [Ruminiclostridium cellulolyticum H10]